MRWVRITTHEGRCTRAENCREFGGRGAAVRHVIRSGGARAPRSAFTMRRFARILTNQRTGQVSELSAANDAEGGAYDDEVLRCRPRATKSGVTQAAWVPQAHGTSLANEWGTIQEVRARGALRLCVLLRKHVLIRRISRVGVPRMCFWPRSASTRRCASTSRMPMPNMTTIAKATIAIAA